MSASTLVFAASCAFIAWAGFCRLTRANASTRLEIRAAVWFITIAAGNGVVVSAMGARQDWPAALLAAACGAMLAATAKHWRHAVPEHYRDEPPAGRLS